MGQNVLLCVEFCRVKLLICKILSLTLVMGFQANIARRVWHHPEITHMEYFACSGTVGIVGRIINNRARAPTLEQHCNNLPDITMCLVLSVLVRYRGRRLHFVTPWTVGYCSENVAGMRYRGRHARPKLKIAVGWMHGASISYSRDAVCQ